MSKYEDILKQLNISATAENKKIVKAMVHALINNGSANMVQQAIDVDFSQVQYLYDILSSMKEFFDYRYNTKIDLTTFLTYILSGQPLNMNAVFCPGYTDSGYKNYVGGNNRMRLAQLSNLRALFTEMQIPTNFKIELADIFLENTNGFINANWHDELDEHRKVFIDTASQLFDQKEIIKLSDVFSKTEFEQGFVNPNLCDGKTYNSFYKNNMEFYKKMNWNDSEIKNRNDRLFTIYTIIAEYINEQQNGIYLPMETMYSRSKVMTKNNTCTMYLNKQG